MGLGYGWLNLGSFILGLTAWVLPVVSMVRQQKKGGSCFVLLMAGSFTACTISLCFQILYGNYLVEIRDWSALEDTSGAIALAAAALLTVTLLLNGITLLGYCRSRREEESRPKD